MLNATDAKVDNAAQATGDYRLLAFAGEMGEESCRFFARYLGSELWE